ncbi:MAG: hypothetical protein V3U75_01400 [Methylococcaceae bacterium]
MKNGFAQTKIEGLTTITVSELSGGGLVIAAITLPFEPDIDNRVTSSSMMLKEETATMLKEILRHWEP